MTTTRARARHMSERGRYGALTDRYTENHRHRTHMTPSHNALAKQSDKRCWMARIVAYSRYYDRHVSDSAETKFTLTFKPTFGHCVLMKKLYNLLDAIVDEQLSNIASESRIRCLHENEYFRIDAQSRLGSMIGSLRKRMHCVLIVQHMAAN